jgi:multisubunit Na+/H+ antiporter MnhE subunit
MSDHSEAAQQPVGLRAGEPRQREELREQLGGRRALAPILSWLTWWMLMMSFWVAIDDSLESDELLAGAGAAALAALAAEVITYQAAVRFRLHPRWLLPALRLPAEVARDTWIVFAALARALARGQLPDGEFAELPVRYGDATAVGQTRRVLLTGAQSLAPNMFVLGLDPERDVMVVHRLVSDRTRS